MRGLTLEEVHLAELDHIHSCIWRKLANSVCSKIGGLRQDKSDSNNSYYYQWLFLSYGY